MEGEEFFFDEAIKSLTALNDLDLDPEDRDMIASMASRLVILKKVSERTAATNVKPCGCYTARQGHQVICALHWAMAKERG